MDYKLDKNRLVKKPSDPYEYIHDYGLDYQTNHIYLFGSEDYALASGESSEPGIEYTIANRFIKNMQICMRANPNKPILIHMKSNGGDSTEGMAIYDTIKTCPVPVTILSYTHARSMTSIILQAADKRVLMPSSYFMIHDGEISVYGTAKQVNSYVEFEKHFSAQMMNIYVEAMRNKGFLDNDKVRYKWLRSRMDQKEEVYMLPDEAIACGFADEIFNGNWATLVKE